MSTDWLHDPDGLWRSTGLGREEFVQKLLSTLIVGHERHRWNVPETPSERGLQFLNALVGAYFEGLVLEDPSFVDEYEFPRRHDDERSGWPDQAVVTPDLLVLIELKTEIQSHRSDQLPHYLDLAAHHHHPDRHVALLYLTPPMEAAEPSLLPGGSRYGHATWGQVAPLIERRWAGSPVEWERTVADRLLWWLDAVETQHPPPAREAVPQPVVEEEPSEDDVDLVLRKAADVQRTGRQTAVELWPGSPDLLDELRLRVRTRLRDGVTVNDVPIRNVLPWLWTAGSSGGTPITETGRTHGYELRLSRYEHDLW